MIMIFQNIKIKVLVKNKFISDIGKVSFSLGLFLLPSAFIISAILLLISAFIGFFMSETSFFEDKFNKLLSIGLSLIIISSLINAFTYVLLNKTNLITGLNREIGIFNWIPLLFCFLDFNII